MQQKKTPSDTGIDLWISCEYAKISHLVASLLLYVI